MKSEDIKQLLQHFIDINEMGVEHFPDVRKMIGTI